MESHGRIYPQRSGPCRSPPWPSVLGTLLEGLGMRKRSDDSAGACWHYRGQVLTWAPDCGLLRVFPLKKSRRSWHQQAETGLFCEVLELLRGNDKEVAVCYEEQFQTSREESNCVDPACQ